MPVTAPTLGSARGATSVRSQLADGTTSASISASTSTSGSSSAIAWSWALTLSEQVSQRRPSTETRTSFPAASRGSLQCPHEGDQVGLFLGVQAQLQDQVKELNRVLQRQQPAVVQVRRRVLDAT